MAKELPYFQFEPAEYLTKDVSFCSLSAQGLFINICSYYWQRECKLTLKQLLKRLDYEKELNELIEEGIVKVECSDIIIDFLDSQYEKATKQSQVNSINGSKGGRPKKIKQYKTELKPNKNPNKSESKGIREEKIKEDESKSANEFFKTKTDFLKWFSEVREKETGMPSNFNTLYPEQQTELFTLKKSYTFDDFNKALKNLCQDKWALEKNQVIPKHFLNLDNFSKYLNAKQKEGRALTDIMKNG